MKTCAKCGTEKPLDEFSRNKRAKDGRLSRCKPCERLRVAEYRKRNPDKVRAYSITSTERRAAYRAENRLRYADHNFNRESMDRLISPDLFIEIISKAVVFERDHYTCKICCVPLRMDLPPESASHPDYPTIDHVYPLAKGGEHSYANVQATHRRCNTQKRNQILLSDVA